MSASSSSDETTKPNEVKEVDVESEQGKVAKTHGLMMNDCDTVTTTAISDKKKCQTTRKVDCRYHCHHRKKPMKT